MDLLNEIYEVQRLHLRSTELDGEQLTREFLLRRAAVIDRLADSPLDPDEAAQQLIDADTYARELLAHDLANGTSHGPIPAGDLRWTDHPRSYARQEHEAWVLTQDLQSRSGDETSPSASDA
ncbi:hypothetical protein ABTX35_25510 [Streptomyces sp. NPDC096080]|uniref:hypothetical protein n=1 Tax=Streptomyces sp. NPDC096080 TaxID=3156693 RepID=UPI0033292A6F